jgi:PadR family transcriptional regulator, regulatory protein PadR
MTESTGLLTGLCSGRVFLETLLRTDNGFLTSSPMDIPQENEYAHVDIPQERSAGQQNMDTIKSEVLQGTLDLMILKTLHALGPLHGFGIARRIERLSHDVLQMNEGTVYTSLLRLKQQGWISAEWGTSENNRKAKFYSITKRGQKQLEVERANWERISGVIGRVLQLEGER